MATPDLATSSEYSECTEPVTSPGTLTLSVTSGVQDGVCRTRRDTLKAYHRFNRRAKLWFLPYFPTTLETFPEYLQVVQDREAYHQLTRTSPHKSTWYHESEHDYIYLSYHTYSGTHSELYLLFRADTLVRVIFEITLPRERAHIMRRHYRLARRFGLRVVEDEYK